MDGLVTVPRRKRYLPMLARILTLLVIGIEVLAYSRPPMNSVPVIVSGFAAMPFAGWASVTEVGVTDGSG